MEGFTVADALAKLVEERRDYARLIENTSYDVGFYKPDGVDSQTPHTRDELYIVAAGTGEFACDGQTKPFGPGDVLFVSAGVPHRFLNFSNDFSAWVVFFGPQTSK